MQLKRFSRPRVLFPFVIFMAVFGPCVFLLSFSVDFDNTARGVSVPKVGESIGVRTLKDLYRPGPVNWLSTFSSPPVETVNDVIRAAAFKAMIKMMEVRTPPLWHGDTVAIIGSNIEYVVKRLHSEYKRLTIIGGERNATALASLRKTYNASRVFFHLTSDVKNDLVGNIPAHSVDMLLVWDLEGGLLATGGMTTIVGLSHKLLKDGDYVHRYVAIAFSMARKWPLPRDALLMSKNRYVTMQEGTMAAPDYPVVLLRDSVRQWERAETGLVEQEPFLEKCRSTGEHLRDLDVLLRMTADVLEELGVTYWLDSGTLLGAYRFNAYNPMEDDHDIVVDYDEWLLNVVQFREMMAKRIEALGRFGSFVSFDDGENAQETYLYYIPQLFMKRTNGSPDKGNPQIDIILAKWDTKHQEYQIMAQLFHSQTIQGFPRNIMFSQAVQTKWKTAHGFLGSLPILGRQYPVPYDVEGYSAVWYAPSDYMNQMVMRQMKARDDFCSHAVAFVYASKQPHLVQKMVARLKEVFPDSFNSQTCPLCRCVDSDCKVERTVVPLDPMPPTPPKRMIPLI